jgi:hypothetical protein
LALSDPQGLWAIRFCVGLVKLAIAQRQPRARTIALFGTMFSKGAAEFVSQRFPILAPVREALIMSGQLP